MLSALRRNRRLNHVAIVRASCVPGGPDRFGCAGWPRRPARRYPKYCREGEPRGWGISRPGVAETRPPMCGIAGFVNPDGRTADRAVVERMTATLTHRGPDGDGFYVDRNV